MIEKVPVNRTFSITDFGVWCKGRRRFKKKMICKSFVFIHNEKQNRNFIEFHRCNIYFQIRVTYICV